MPQGIDPAVQSRCLVLYHAWLVGFACAVSPTGLCMKAFLFQFDSFSAAWVPIYLPVLTRASDGFFAFSGIIQYAPAFCAPVMRPSPQRATTRRLERCQRSAASIAEMYFMPYIVYISSLTILYSQHGIMSSVFRREHTKIQTDCLFKKDIIINRCVSRLFSEVPVNALTAIPEEGGTEHVFQIRKEKTRKATAPFLRVVAFRRIRLKKLQIVAGRAFFSHFTVSRSVSFSERGV